MIEPFLEGIAQALLPCSWVVVFPALIIGITTKRVRILAAFALSVVLLSWMAVSGWLAPPVWVAGLALLIGAAAWWRWGLRMASAATIGVGAAWAWQPCVGEELGLVLNTAQHDPWGALPGLAAFMLGVLVVGFGLGLILGLLIRRVTDRKLDRPASAIVGLLGLSMVVGLYPTVASIFARWSTELWA